MLNKCQRKIIFLIEVVKYVLILDAIRINLSFVKEKLKRHLEGIGCVNFIILSFGGNEEVVDNKLCENNQHSFGLVELENEEGVHVRCIKCGYNPSYQERHALLYGKIPIAKGIKWLVKNNDK